MKTNPFFRTGFFTAVPALVAASLLLPLMAEDLQVPAKYPTIQAAVDAAADGDTIVIAPGIYTEQAKVVGKRLHITGRPGARLRAFNEMEPSSLKRPSLRGFGEAPYAILSILLSEVDVTGLTFEGDYILNDLIAGTTYSVWGLFFASSSGVVENCRFQGFRNREFGGQVRSTGLSADNYIDNGESDRPAALLVNVAVRHCIFADNEISLGLQGDDVAAPETLRLQFTVADSAFHGVGPKGGTGNMLGINIANGAGGEIGGNRFSDFSYTGSSSGYSFGLAAADQAWGDQRRPGIPHPLPLQRLRLSNNNFQTNQIHVFVGAGAGAEVVRNRFEGTAPGARPCQLVLVGGPNRVAGNSFFRAPKGILLFGNDPDYGTALGIAHDNELSENRFCHVAIPVEIEPLVVNTREEKRLDCPDLFPPLTITSAITLTWPFDGGGSVLEVAPAADGPWSPAGGAPTATAVATAVTLPTDQQHRFFRLRLP